MLKPVSIILLFFFAEFSLSGQKRDSLFKHYILKEVPQNKYGEILIAKDGKVLVSASEFSFILVTGGNVSAFTFGLDKQDYGIKNLKSIFTGAPLKAMAESSDNNIFFSTAENQITFLKNSDSGHCDIPPFYFPPKGETKKEITSLWFDKGNSLYIGTTDGAFYIVPQAGTNATLNTGKYLIGRAPDSSMAVLKGELAVKKNPVQKETAIYCFAESGINKNTVWIGTGLGLLTYNKISGLITNVLTPKEKLSITHIEILGNGDIWFSTLEKGMCVYHQVSSTAEFFPYPKKKTGGQTMFPVQDFCIKSTADFFVAVKDSTPAIFNINTKSYQFLSDTSFVLSKNSTTIIRVDTSGNFYFIKGGLLYSANVADNPLWIGSDTLKTKYTPFIYGVTDFNHREITNLVTNPELLKKLELSYKENSIIIYLTSNYYSANKPIQFEWTLEGDIKDWVVMPPFNADNDSSNTIELPQIKPGKYNLRVRVKVGNGEWSKEEAAMEIIVNPPYWKTWWFWLLTLFVAGALATYFLWWRIKIIKKREKEKFGYEKQILELEAKALRAQMNPHFIFNCLNSIKALTLNSETQKATEYLTTFSKLIRTLFQNSDKRLISLYDEIATCQLYVQLEAMRLNDNLHYSFDIDPNLDLKSVMVPALIIQPFIENAIWHGIVPKGEGNINITVKGDDEKVICEVDDDGIGREMSRHNKPFTPVIHESKGVHLSQERLNLGNLLNEMNATIETKDKYYDGVAAGTLVTLTFNLN